MKLKQLPGCVDQARTWQRYLKSRGIYSGSIDGKLEGATAAATQNYQKKTGKRDDDLFCLSFERPDKDHFHPKDSTVNLNGLAAVLRPLGYGYYLLTGKDLVVTSGLRKPETQARLMYDKAKRSFNAFSIYNPTLSDPIKDAYDEKTKAGAGEQATIDAMTAVIQAQVNGHAYISRHLKGRAFDVRNGTMSGCEKEAFEKVLAVVLPSGKLIKHEPGGESHFHIQF